MCRNIHVLFNFDPPATDAEIRAAALQYVRKVSGYANPSAANAEAFELAVERVALTYGDRPVELRHSLCNTRDYHYQARIV